MGESPRHNARRKKQASVTSRERMRGKRAARVLCVFIAVVIAFAAGFLVRSQTAFVASLGFPLSQEEDAAGAGSATKKTTYDSAAMRVSEVEDLLNANSLDVYDVSTAANSMLSALMKATNDPYATYFDPDRYAKYIKETADRSYAGIGVLFSDYNGRAYVVDVFEGSEAEAKGVVQGDFVEAIDGDSSHEWTMTEVVNALAREDGDSVTITWMHPVSLDAETGSEFTTTLTCRRFEEANLSTGLTGDVGYIRLRQFTQNSSDLVKNAVSSLTSQGAAAFVLDLRDNPGGYLTQAVDVASLFVQSGVLVQIQTVEGTTTKTASGVTVTQAPLVVLVNGYTSAAAEVLAAALQDNQRATVVGETTLGKGSVQVVRELSFGGAVRYTAAYYRTPLGHDIDGIGVVPSTVVGPGSDPDSDTQRLVAIDVASSAADALDALVPLA
ncbi:MULTISPECIES: S41 family peptidase [unclassified Adlercreutzia]|uniref:S41 family peptidase n=1 Tax=unclassified Adlercreutzia TaxID=2636013 RepID=UPI0013EAA2A0|nr:MULTISPECIES: S41 family peptidase [unclassified Adlercreutzia]